MAKRKKIGYGPYDFDGKRNSKVWLQNKFLNTIEKLEPKQKRKPLGDLAARPFEEYKNYRETKDEKTILRRRQVSERWKKRSGETSFFNLLSEDDPLRESIWRWGEKYHLNSAWCYEIALSTLHHWYEFKEATGKRFEDIPFYSHPKYLGFGSLVMVYDLTRMPYNSLNKKQKELVDSFSEEDKCLVEFFDEHQRIYMSFYPHDPHIWDDKHFMDQTNELIKKALPSINELIEKALPPINYALPVFNLLSKSDRVDLQKILHRRAEELLSRRAGELLNRINEYAKKNSIQPSEFGEDVNIRFEWAVRYQVFDERFYSIGSNPDMDQFEKQNAYGRVRKAVLHILKLVDLQPKKSPKGRSRTL
jgi:hypothetical protein